MSTLYSVDKTENNTARVGGHAAWATEYDLATNTYRALDVNTNTFCAGGNQLGNGSWINVGGNQAVTTGGVADADVNITAATTNSGAYDDLSGGRAVRIITPCTDDSCNWTEDVDGMPTNRWYPYVETLEDGSVIIIGGELWGGYVNSVNQMQNVPTYEFWPTRGDPVNNTFLEVTQPTNLYPLTWLLPNGLLFMQANWQTTLLNYTTNEETALPNITRAQRTYPSSGATAMLPLTSANDWIPTLLFCGGMDPVRDDWDTFKWKVVDTNTSSSCVSINPTEDNPQWVDDDDLPENRGMGNFIILPDTRLFLVNGVSKGSAGYGSAAWAINQSYGQDPVMRSAYYNGSAPSGSRWQTEGLPESTVGRLYHSTATLLPDGSVFIAGSNPNADVIDDANNATYVYKTEYRAEIFYPDYYDQTRPTFTGLPSSISYGGDYFNLTIPEAGMLGKQPSQVVVSLMRTGFSTHSMNMGMRYIEMGSSHTVYSDGTVVMHVGQMSPNPALFTPGPALLFVTIDGVPSVGQEVMVGSGVIETQPLGVTSVLPKSAKLTTAYNATTAGTTTSSGTTTSGTSGSSSPKVTTAASTTSGAESAHQVRLAFGAVALGLAFLLI